MLHISQKMGFFTQRIKRTGCLSKSKKSETYVMPSEVEKAGVKFSKFKISKEPYIFKENKNNPRVFK